MKRPNRFLIRAVSLFIGAAMLSGCGAMAMPALTEEQEDQIVQYAADAVMRHVYTRNMRLADLSLYEEKEETEKADETKEPAGIMDPVADTPVTDRSEETASKGFADVLLPEGCSMEYTGYEITDSYPRTEDVAFVIDASVGKKLLILSFTIANNGTESTYVDVNGRKPSCVLQINDTDKCFIQVTLLTDDLTTYSGSLDAGQEVPLVMIAEIPEEAADGIETLKLSVTAEGSSATAVLQ